MIYNQISKGELYSLYHHKRQSVAQIARMLECSQNRINYWLRKYNIKKRSISEAIYDLRNPLGDPFSLKKPKTLEQSILFGLGLGLYWGEGLKRGKGAVRLTNSDARVIIKFIEFLDKFFNIDKSKLRFSLQIFNDISPQKSLRYWCKTLGVNKRQFYKTIVSCVRGAGTYKNRSENGTVILYFNNVKLKKIILEMIEKL